MMMMMTSCRAKNKNKNKKTKSLAIGFVQSSLGMALKVPSIRQYGLDLATQWM